MRRLIRTWGANDNRLHRMRVRFLLMVSIRRAASHRTINKTDAAEPAVTHGSEPSNAWNRNHIDRGSMDKLTTPAPNQVSSFPLCGKRPADNAPTIKKMLTNPMPQSKKKTNPVTHPVAPASQRIFLESGTISAFCSIWARLIFTSSITIATSHKATSKTEAKVRPN